MAGPRALHSDPLGSHAHTSPPDPRRWNVLYQDKGLSPPGRGPAVCPRMSAQTPYASQERVCHPCSGWGPSWGRARQGPQQAALPGLRFLIPVGAGVSRCSRPLPAPPPPAPWLSLLLEEESLEHLTGIPALQSPGGHKACPGHLLLLRPLKLHQPEGDPEQGLFLCTWVVTAPRRAPFSHPGCLPQPPAHLDLGPAGLRSPGLGSRRDPTGWP